MRSYKPKTRKQRKLIQDWVARLRNPNSRQARNQLKADSGNGYCCLGHLCIVAGGKFVKHDPERFNKAFCLVGDVGEESSFLPTIIAKKLGFSSDNPKVIIGDTAMALTDLNDLRGFSLKEIADVVEADWLKGRPLKSHPKLIFLQITDKIQGQ